MKRQSEVTGKSAPYLYEYYNVVCATPHNGTNIRNALARILNSIVELLNNRAQIPRMIIVIPDWDLVRNMNHFDSGATYMAERSMHWICNEIDKIFEICKDEYMHRKKGALIAGEPKIIWVKMLYRPNPSDCIKIRHKFNNALNDTLLLHKHTYLADVAVPTSNFDRCNNITPSGKEHFWRDLDAQLRDFDRQKITLKPINPKPKTEQKTESKTKKK